MASSEERALALPSPPSGERGPKRLEERVLSPEDKEVLESLHDLLAVGFTRDKAFSQLIENPPAGESWRYRPQFLFFKDVRGELEFEEGRFFSPSTGIVESGQLFATTRDGWGKGLKGPRVTGIYRDGQAQIEIRPSFDAGNPFESEVLPGVSLITIREDGGIIGRNGKGKERPLTREEKGNLVGVFRQITARAQQNLARVEAAR